MINTHCVICGKKFLAKEGSTFRQPQWYRESDGARVRCASIYMMTREDSYGRDVIILVTRIHDCEERRAQTTLAAPPAPTIIGALALIRPHVRAWAADEVERAIDGAPPDIERGAIAFVHAIRATLKIHHRPKPEGGQT